MCRGRNPGILLSFLCLWFWNFLKWTLIPSVSREERKASWYWFGGRRSAHSWGAKGNRAIWKGRADTQGDRAQGGYLESWPPAPVCLDTGARRPYLPGREAGLCAVNPALDEILPSVTQVWTEWKSETQTLNKRGLVLLSPGFISTGSKPV